MTIATTIIKSGPYTGNDSTVVFAYAFRILAQTELIVTKTTISTGVVVTLVLTTDYTVSGVGDAAGGDVTTVATPTTDENIFIYRSSPLVQATDFLNQGAFFPEIHEDQFDKIINIIQELNDQLGRQPALDIDSAFSGLSLADPVAGSHLIWNAGLTGLENAIFASASAFTLNAYWEAVLDDGNLATSLASMLFSSDMQAFLVTANYAAARTALAVGGLAEVNVFTTDQFFTEGIGPEYLQNLSFAATNDDPTAGDLTIDLLSKAGTNPTATDKVQIAFRNATLTTNGYTVVDAVAATEVLLPSGGTLGFTANEDGYVYVYAINNAGTIELAIAKKAVFDESTTHTTVAIDATSDSDNVLYSTTARANIAVRLIGRIRITTGAVAGEWDNAATELEVWTPAMKKTGDIVQFVYDTDGEVNTGTDTIPSDDVALPELSDGDQYMSKAITPKSSINTLLINITLNLATTAGGTMAVVLNDGTTVLALNAKYVATTNNPDLIHLTWPMVAGSVSALTFNAVAGNSAAGTTTLNGASGSRLYFGGLASLIAITEIQA